MGFGRLRALLMIGTGAGGEGFGKSSDSSFPSERDKEEGGGRPSKRSPAIVGV